MNIFFGTRLRDNYNIRYFQSPKVYTYTGDSIYDFSNQDITKFPLIYDFEIILVDNEYHEIGNHIKYYSQEFGILLDFPWWDHADTDIRYFTKEQIPLGPINKPFDDFEEGWQIVIFEKNHYIYILVGSTPSFTREFHTWFKVPKDDYLKQWETLIRFLKSQ